MIYRASGLRYRYPGADRDAVRDVDLAVPRGAFYAVIGPNGCGKTTLFRLLLGALQPDAGAIEYDGRSVGTRDGIGSKAGPGSVHPGSAQPDLDARRDPWDRRELARRVGVVPQSEELVFPLTVRELVAMGRYPHLGPWHGERAADRSAVGSAMARCDIVDLAPRPMGTLSGGERQRARLARALAQEPDTLVLDEPTASLDIAHEMGIFELLRGLADSGVTVLMVTHNLNVAARYADRLLLMDRGRPIAEGIPADVFTADTLETVYRWPIAVAEHPGPGPDTGAPQVTPLRGGDRSAHGGLATDGDSAQHTTEPRDS